MEELYEEGDGEESADKISRQFNIVNTKYTNVMKGAAQAIKTIKSKNERHERRDEVRRDEERSPRRRSRGRSRER